MRRVGFTRGSVIGGMILAVALLWFSGSHVGAVVIAALLIGVLLHNQFTRWREEQLARRLRFEGVKRPSGGGKGSVPETGL